MCLKSKDTCLRIKLDCGHECCYYCLKDKSKNKYICCIDCNKITYKNINNIHENIIISRQNLWLYSARQKGIWWCYDMTISAQLDLMSTDYNKRKLLQENKLSTPPKSHKDIKFDKIDHNLNFEGNCNFVNYDDAQEMDNVEPDIDLQYCIEIANVSYYIDLDENMQRNCKDISKIREIKRIEIPDIIFDTLPNKQQNIIHYLKTQNIIGMSGLKFI